MLRDRFARRDNRGRRLGRQGRFHFDRLVLDDFGLLLEAEVVDVTGQFTTITGEHFVKTQNIGIFISVSRVTLGGSTSFDKHFGLNYNSK